MNTKKSIAFITFATLPLPAVRGGAVETLIDNICNQNEEDNSLHIDVYSIFDEDAIAAASCFKNTNYIYYYGSKNKRFSFKNIIFKVTGLRNVIIASQREFHYLVCYTDRNGSH